MHCDCCDVILTPQEATRKSKSTGEYMNTCNRCTAEIGIATIEGNNYRDPRQRDDDIFPEEDDMVDEADLEDFYDADESWDDQYAAS